MAEKYQNYFILTYEAMLKFDLRKYVYFLIYPYNTDHDVQVLFLQNSKCVFLISSHVPSSVLSIAYISDPRG